MGLGADAINDRKVLEGVMEELKAISGQQPVKTTARKSVASFKLREGFAIGCKVTLRGERMYEFLDRLLSIAIPRERDFRGLDPKSFDGRGNYTIGIKEHIIFPEIDYDKVQKIRGLDISITTSANNNDEGLKLLTALKFPFKTISITRFHPFSDKLLNGHKKLPAALFIIISGILFLVIKSFFIISTLSLIHI